MKKTYTLESHALASLYDFFLSKRWFSVQLMVDDNLMLTLYRKEHFETLTNTFSLGVPCILPVYFGLRPFAPFQYILLIKKKNIHRFFI
jgi:hypothetical protein